MVKSYITFFALVFTLLFYLGLLCLSFTLSVCQCLRLSFITRSVFCSLPPSLLSAISYRISVTYLFILFVAVTPIVSVILNWNKPRRCYSYVQIFILRQLFYPRDLYGELRAQVKQPFSSDIHSTTSEIVQLLSLFSNHDTS